MRFAYNDFELRPVTYIDGKNTYPNEISIDKFLGKGQYIAIGKLVWNGKNEDWDLHSYGTRFLAQSTQGLNNYLLNFCRTYGINYSGDLDENYFGEY